MGKTRDTGFLTNGLWQDASNNIGIGGSPSGSYKLQVTGASLFTGADLATDGLGNVNIFTTDAAATGKGGSLAFGGGTTGGTSPYAFAKIEGIYDGSAAYNGAMLFSTNNGGTIAERMRITSTGNVGIGTSSPVGIGGGYTAVDIQGSNGGGINFGPSTAKSFLYADVFGGYLGTSYNSPYIFYTNSAERMRITNGGYTKISNTGSYEYVNASIHEVRNSAADWILYGTNSHASSPSGYYISYPAASPNNTSNFFIACADSSAARFRVASNGNCYNVTGTYTSGVSDIRYKEQVTDANSQWDDIKNLRVVNFKFKKDVEENGDNALKHIGFIAQEVEKTSPHLIEEMFDEKTGETWKTIKASIIHTKAIKALQEAMAKIEELEAKVSALENKS